MRFKGGSYDPRVVTIAGALIRDAGEAHEKVLRRVEAKARDALAAAANAARCLEHYCDELERFLDVDFLRICASDRGVVMMLHLFTVLYQANESLLEGVRCDIGRGEILLRRSEERLTRACPRIAALKGRFEEQVAKMPNVEQVAESLPFAFRRQRAGEVIATLSGVPEGDAGAAAEDWASPAPRYAYSDEDLDVVGT